MQSLKNTKSKPVGRPPKMIKPYKYSKRNTVVFVILVIIFLALAFKLGASTVANEPIQDASDSATLATPTPTRPPLTVCDDHTLQITDGEIIKECYVNITPTPTPTPQPAKRSLQPSDEEIVAYIQSKDWDASTAVRIAKSENFYNYSKSFDCSRMGGVNNDGTRDYGLWQINDVHIRSGAITIEDALDCQKATDFAYRLYKGRGNWSAWSAFNNGSYLAHADTL